ncbi:endonuclease domain-containing 1 protein [Xenopus tropicalis]|uniref:Endonuclease domain-containing 1 protein n=1 Tax=Xenopus tropicalis TaxID=8364 RepID=A0A803JXG5_XENTR|nr:endonuclease domain-containing 1 protein [Xenopus tropicalis]|eukprot:XP_017948005.1 PREDICTED: endonuclease domain-containing 1 protein-like [Xenopus tropicalis]
MKMMLSLAWLLIAIAHKAEPLISANFKACKKFFYRGQLPAGFASIALPHRFNPSDLPDGIKAKELTSPAYICQKYGNRVYFASLYDRGRRVPLYSAYILDRRPTSKPINKRQTFFNIEPQLIYRQLDGTMLPERNTSNNIKTFNTKHNISPREQKNQPSSLINTSQAVDADYRNSGYDRGHVNPRGHHVTDDEQKGTFTLTNVVPMAKKLNNEFWSQYENDMIGSAKGCKTMYVVTGIVPSKEWIKGDRVNIPKYMWNAYCCVGKDDKPIKSGAGLRKNDDSDKPVEKMQINELQKRLKKLLVKENISIFQNNCSKKLQTSRKAAAAYNANC